MIKYALRGCCAIELKQLDYLIAVAESGSMHLAAERLHVSQQNISRVLKQLESELRIKIFNKSTVGTKLTPEGEKVYLHALKIRKEVQLLLEDITTDTLSLHYTLAHPSNYNVDSYPLTLPQYNNASLQKSQSKIENFNLLLCYKLIFLKKKKKKQKT